MPRLTLRRVAAAFAIATPLVLGGFILGRQTSDTGFRVFQQVFSIVSRDALDSLNNDSLYESAARGMVAGLDDAYADLFSPEEYARFNRNQLRNRYGGVGLRILSANGWVTVWRVIEGGPASAAGIQKGDKIVAVNDSSAQGWTIDRVSNNLTGTPGTPVKVTIERDGQRHSYDITRAVISISAVPFTTMLPGNVGYIPFGTSFSDRSARDVGAAVQTLQDQGAQSIILDMRGNPGGSLEQAVSLANVFLEPPRRRHAPRAGRAGDPLGPSGRGDDRRRLGIGIGDRRRCAAGLRSRAAGRDDVVREGTRAGRLSAPGRLGAEAHHGALVHAELTAHPAHARGQRAA